MEGFDWLWVLGPATGAVIGYITNDIAVRMLLRPYEEKRLFGRRVPFTPGLIAKERKGLARAIRDVLDRELLSAEVLGSALLAPEMMEKLSAAADEAIARIRAEEKNPRALLAAPLGEERLTTLENKAVMNAREFALKKLMESGVEKQLAAVTMQEAKTRLASSMGMLSAILLDEKRSAQYEAKIAQVIRETIETRGPEFLDETIGNAIGEVMEKPVCELTASLPLDDMRDALLKQYARLIETRLPDMMRMIDLGRIVEEKINAISMQELEAMIMSVMKKELRAIVWLGALLGGVLGVVQTLLSQIL